MIRKQVMEIDVITKRNRSAGPAEKLDTGQRIPNAKHLLERYTKMHQRELKPLMLVMTRRIIRANVKFANFTETLANANLEQSVNLSTINTTDRT